MIKNVINNASPINTWFGGICWLPSACLRNERTITILGKEVISMSIAGASVRIVSSRNIWTVAATSFGVFAFVMLIPTLGIVISSAAISVLKANIPVITTTAARIVFLNFPLFILLFILFAQFSHDALDHLIPAIDKLFPLLKVGRFQFLVKTGLGFQPVLCHILIRLLLYFFNSFIIGNFRQKIYGLSGIAQQQHFAGEFHDIKYAFSVNVFLRYDTDDILAFYRD